MIPFEVHQRKAGLVQAVKKNEPETIAKITKNKPKIRFINNSKFVNYPDSTYITRTNPISDTYTIEPNLFFVKKRL